MAAEVDLSAAITATCVQLLVRNHDEVHAFAELIDGYSTYVQQATEARDHVRDLEKKLVQLQDDRDTIAAALQRTERAIQRSPDIDALEAKVASLSQDLSQSYKASTDLAQQLVHATNAVQSLRNEVEEKAKRITTLEENLEAANSRNEYLENALREKTNVAELAASEAAAEIQLRIVMEEKLKKAEMENRDFVDRLMDFKMKEADKINEVNSMYQDMVERLKASHLQELARKAAGGVLRRSEEMADSFVPSGVPSNVKSTTRVHEGECLSVVFGTKNGVLFTGGMDRLVKVWDGLNMIEKHTLRGSLGSIMDISVSEDNRLLLGAGTDNKIQLWDVDTGRIQHTLTGHTDKVCSVEFSKAARSRAVSSSYDRTINVWDLHKGYGIQTIMTHSTCNGLCLTLDGAMICSGHTDGNLRFWDIRTGRLANEVAAHARGITSVSMSQSGTAVLSNGRDNVLNLFDVRTFEARCTLRAPGYRVPSNWSRACLSPDDKHVAAGSSDGSVFVWAQATGAVERVLRGHASAALACAWSDLGRPLVSSDKNGCLIVWE